MATPSGSNKPTPAAGHAPFTPAAGSPSANANKTVTRSPVSHMKRSRADTLRGMEHSLSQQGHTPRSSNAQGSSPSFLGTPGQSHGGPGLGISLNTPGVATPGGAAMQRVGSTSFGLSNLGIDGSILNADREAFAKLRIAEIRDLLMTRWGQVSRVGVQRVATRLGLECLWETGEHEETGILDVAGDGILLQITFKGEAIDNTHLSFPATEVSGRLREPDDDKRGEAILTKDLVGWEDEQARGYYVDLEKFGTNMQHLAEIDHLGKSGVRCFEAVDGVYKSLRDVETWWRKRPGCENAFDTLAKGPGWVRNHANGKVGIRLDYWLHMWQVRRRDKTEEWYAAPASREPNMYGVRIGVSPLHVNADTFVTPVTPVRISTDWFDFMDDLSLDDESTDLPQFPPLQLTRKEPDPTYLAVAEVTQAGEAGSSVPRPLPNIMFKASFDPPLPISYVTSTALLGQHGEGARSYAALLFEDTGIDLQRPDAVITLERQVHHAPSDEDKHVLCSVSNANTLPAYLLKELPFSHPMDLLQVLPVLRQWAWLHQLILKSMGQPVRASGKSQQDSSMASTSAKAKQSPKPKKSKKRPSAKEVRALLKAGVTWAPSSDTDSSDDDDKPTSQPQDVYDETVDVSLELPEPTMAPDGSQMPPNGVNLTLSIPVGPNKDPVMVQFSLEPGPTLTPVNSEGAGVSADFVRKMTRVLESIGDVGVLAVWVREYMREQEEKQDDADKEMKDA